jgi:PilZ domain
MGLGQAVTTASTEISRARRYEIGTLIRYRVRGEREWHEGMTENISVSGVLIRARQALNPKQAIEMRFFLPIELDGECAAEVFCRGLVIRSSKCRFPAGSVTIAAKIVHSRFLRPMGGKEDLAREAPNGKQRLGY